MPCRWTPINLSLPTPNLPEDVAIILGKKLRWELREIFASDVYSSDMRFVIGFIEFYDNLLTEGAQRVHMLLGPTKFVAIRFMRGSGRGLT